MDDNKNIRPPRQALAEALILSSEILKNIELSEISLTNIALKASRLARILNDFDYQQIMEYEAGGYPSTAYGVAKEIWELGILAGRTYEIHVPNSNDTKQYMYTESIEQLEEALRTAEIALRSAKDPDISISSANPNQFVSAGIDHSYERASIRSSVSNHAEKVASRRKFIYHYALQKHYELKFSGISDDIFTRIRDTVDERIGQLIPNAIQKFTAVHESLLSENPENWANAVHSCRRILQDLADAIFPPTDEDRVIQQKNKAKSIKLGKDQYINRIVAYVEDNSESERFRELVGSNLAYLGDRLDSIFSASQKGSHSTVSHEEADRYVIYTYLLVGDILSLANLESE